MLGLPIFVSFGFHCAMQEAPLFQIDVVYLSNGNK